MTSLPKLNLIKVIICPQFQFIYSYLTPIYHLCPYLDLFTYISTYLAFNIYLYLSLFSIIYPCLVIFSLNWHFNAIQGQML